MHFCWLLLTLFMIIFKVLVFCFSALRKKVTIIPVKILFTIITHHIFIWHTAFTKYTKKNKDDIVLTLVELVHGSIQLSYLHTLTFQISTRHLFPCAHAAARKTNS